MKFYQRGKVFLNYLLDRAIDLSDAFLADLYRLPWPALQNLIHKMARLAGDVCWFLRDLPRLPAYKLSGKRWTVIFVGNEHGLLEVTRLFFPDEEVERQEIGRVALWKLQAGVRQWLAGGADLIICELSNVYPWRLKAPFVLIVPTWVRQIAAIPEPAETLIAGRKMHGTRHRIARATRDGFHYRFSQSLEDFDHFYHRMYLPFVKSRHNHLALVTPYERLRRKWFARGGLLLVTRHDVPVAASICYLSDNTCYSIEGGVLDADEQLFQQGVNVLFDWYTVKWGRERGATVYDMGGSRGWRSSGPFAYKSTWRTTVVRLSSVYSNWHVLGQCLSPALREHLNQIGFVSEIGGKFYGALFGEETNQPGEQELRRELAEVQQQGLAGLAVLSPDRVAIRT